MNPYRGLNGAVEELESLYGREEMILRLQSAVRGRRDVLLLGPEGVGKSSLLECAFSWEFRKAMAARRILITPRFEFPVELETDRVFPYLIEQLRSALVPLDDETEGRVREAIRRKMSEQLEPRAMFRSVVDMLVGEFRFRFCMVIDSFERFTSSKNVTMDHHETMRSMLETGSLRFVVSTNYDLSQDSLPKDTRGSLLLQRFSTCDMRVEGLGQEAACAMLDGLKEGFGPDRSMTELLGPRMDQLMQMTGGVPALLLLGAAEAYDQLRANGWAALTDAQWETIHYRTREGAELTMDHWCRMLSEERLDLLKHVAKGPVKPRDTEETGRMGYLERYRGLLTMVGEKYAHTVGLLAEYVPGVEKSRQNIPEYDGPVFTD